MRKVISLIGLFFMMGLIFTSGIFASDSIMIKGSDTMVNLSNNLAEVFMEKNEGIDIAVTGGGSGTGIAALINDQVDIANASRTMKEEEITQAENNGVEVYRIVVGMDGLSVIVNEDNNVNELTLEQIGEIFKGNIKNWQELGGKNKKIVTYGRQSNSGTFVYFRGNVLQADYSANMNRMNGNAQIVEAIRQDESGIGYVGVGYVVDENEEIIDGVNIVNVAVDEESTAVSPLNPENVAEGLYPLARPLNHYVNGKPAGAILEYIDFILSEEGQQVVINTGFYPLTPEYRELNQEILN